MASEKKIFWFEDDKHLLAAHLEKLQKKYEVIIGAHWELIKKTRQQAFDLVLLDIMIHKFSFDVKNQKEVENIEFQDVHWSSIGVEFLKRMRKGEYESYGFKKNVPVIAATARVDYPTREAVENIGVSSFLVKPFTIDKLKTSIEKVLNPPKKQ
jgi:CheY-like chemotaxis protein